MKQKALYTLALEMLNTTNVYNNEINNLRYMNNGRESVLTEMICNRLHNNSIGDTKYEKVYNAIANAMSDYIEQYSAPFFYKQRVRCQFRKWLDKIQEKYDIKVEYIPEQLTIDNVELDTGIAMIKALHDREGKTKKELSEDLRICERAVQKNLRKISPDLYKEKATESVYAPFRLGGQPIQAKIRVQEKEGDKKKYYSTVNTVHPIVLQENIMELGTLIEALSYNYFNNESNISVIIAIDIWSQMSDYARDRIKKYYTIRDKDVIEFIDILEDEFPDNHINSFCTEREMYENNEDMSNREILTYAIKAAGRTCTLEIEDDQGKTKVLNKQTIKYEHTEDNDVIYKAVSSDGIVCYFKENDVKNIFVD